MSERVTYTQQTYYGEAEVQHCWEIREDGAVIAELYADLTTGQIMQVWVADHRRGEGLAREVYETAAAQIDLYHSPDEHCTPEGLTFKQAMGGQTITPDLAYAPE